MPPSEFVQGLCDVFQPKMSAGVDAAKATEEACGLVEGAGLADGQAAHDMPPERVGVAVYGRTCFVSRSLPPYLRTKASFWADSRNHRTG